jgi:hypothetical protein
MYSRAWPVVGHRSVSAVTPRVRGFIGYPEDASMVSGRSPSDMLLLWNQTYSHVMGDGFSHTNWRTRQHDWLGPAYLPLHAMFQILSTLIYIVRPVARYSPVHAYNPLERTFICVPIDAIVELKPEGERAEKVLHAFGLTK